MLTASGAWIPFLAVCNFSGKQEPQHITQPTLAKESTCETTQGSSPAGQGVCVAHYHRRVSVANGQSALRRCYAPVGDALGHWSPAGSSATIRQPSSCSASTTRRATVQGGETPSSRHHTPAGTFSQAVGAAAAVGPGPGSAHSLAVQRPASVLQRRHARWRNQAALTARRTNGAGRPKHKQICLERLGRHHLQPVAASGEKDEST